MKTKIPNRPAHEHDELVPDPQIQREFGICAMTLWRWDKDLELGFPPPIRIRGRKFRSRRLAEAFKQRLLADAVMRRNGERAA
jgi:hypothetical protein